MVLPMQTNKELPLQCERADNLFIYYNKYAVCVASILCYTQSVHTEICQSMIMMMEIQTL